MNTKKMKMLLIIFVCFLTVFFSVDPVHADMSPKPLLTVKTDHFPENSYIALLAKENDIGFSLWHVDKTWFEENKWHASKASDEINMRFYEEVHEKYETDGWYLWGNISSCRADLKFTYMRPEHFRIMIYLADEDRFIVTDQEYECSGFEYTVNVRYENGRVITDRTNSRDSFSRFLLRLLATVAIELFAALFFFKGLNRRNCLIIIAVNIITQLILNVLSFTGISMFSANPALYYPVLLILEICIVLAEGFVYTKMISREDIKHPYYYSAIANILSFAAGLIILPF